MRMIRQLDDEERRAIRKEAMEQTRLAQEATRLSWYKASILVAAGAVLGGAIVTLLTN